MREIDAQNAEAYLHETGRLARGEHAEVCELSGGVSNIVLLVTRQNGERYVVKQARAQLRVPQPWFCGVERVLREIQVLKLCERVLAEDQSPEKPSTSVATPSPIAVHTPRLLFEDRDNFLFAMTAAPANHTTWKQQLMAGHAQVAVAAACGQLLGTLHSRTWQDDRVAEEFNDRKFFDDLRVDPYYRTIAKVHGDLKTEIQQLIDSVWAHRRCLVHGDFSPKNLLVWESGLMLIDFEVGHYGDPAFDLGFFLTHLVLKTFFHHERSAAYLALIQAFVQAYRGCLSQKISADELASLESRTMQNLAGCMLSRVDGKSRVDYRLDENRVRRFAVEIFRNPSSAQSLDAISPLIESHLKS